jgi:hypothetical protein
LLYFVHAYRDEVVGVFVRFRAASFPRHAMTEAGR